MLNIPILKSFSHYQKLLYFFFIALPISLSSQSKSLEDQASDAFFNREYAKAQVLWKEVAQQRANENDIEKEIDAMLEIVRSGMHVSKFDTSEFYAKLAAQKAKANNLENHYGRAMSTLTSVFEFLDQEDSILYAANEVLKCKDISHKFLSDAYSSIAIVYDDKGNPDKNEYYLNKAIEIDRMHQDSSSLPFNLINLGRIKSKKALYNEALEYHFEALSFLRPSTDKFKYPTVYCYISSIFRSLKNYEKSEEYGLKALADCKKLNLSSTRVRAYNELAATSQRREDYEKAIFYYLKSDSIITNKGGRKSYHVNIKNGLAECNLALKNYARTQALINDIDTMIHKIDDNVQLLSFYTIEASFAFETKQKNALDKINKALEYSKEIKIIRTEKRLSSLLSRYYYQKNNYKNSLAYLKSSIFLQDSIFKLEQSYLVHDLEAQYKKKEQDGQIKLLATENNLKSTQIKQQRVLLYGSLIAIVLFGVLLSFIASLFGKVKSQKKVVENSLGEKNVLLKEIHHRVKNNLQVISSLLALQSKYISDDTALDALKQGQDRVHSMALIHQDLYQGKDLVGVSTANYFEQLIDNLFYSYNINEGEVKLNLEVEDLTLDVDTMIPLGLVLNELISNAFKHAFKEGKDGAEITIRLKELNNELILEVKDNGSSITNTKQIEGKSFGFELIKAFSQKLKARLEMNIDNGLSIQLFIKNYSKAA